MDAKKGAGAIATNPYKINGPASISFSGGATSGFMLRQIIDAHGGTLPDDVLVCFANTGLEHPKTYEFIERCEGEWNVPIRWLEYRWSPGIGPRFAEVTPATASRNGEPFSQLIQARGFLPNPVTRFCTTELKIRTMRRFLSSLGWDEFTSCVGLRADEPHRVAKIRGDGPKGEEVVCPMHRAGHTLEDVEAFWDKQPFRLGIDRMYGNCVGCFLKGRHKLAAIARTEPDKLYWWAEAEESVPGAHGAGATFRKDGLTYRIMLKQVGEQPELWGQDCGDETQTCMCHD